MSACSAAVRLTAAACRSQGGVLSRWRNASHRHHAAPSNTESGGNEHMKKTCLLAAMVVATAAPAFAQPGNGAPSGSHYNLNIIGTKKEKSGDMTGSNRHVIFVALNFDDDTPTSPTSVS